MKSSPYLEQRARAAAEAFRFLNEWAAPDFADLSSTEVKRSLFRSNGRYLLSEMLRRDAISNADVGDLASALHHAWSVDDNAEVIDAGHGVTENVFANVYDLLFAREQRATDDTGSHYVYRGQRDARWGLIASACRGHPNVWTLDSPDRKEQMVENILRKLVTPEAKSRPAPPANATEARARLDALIADKARGAKLVAGDAEVTREYRELRAKADNPDPADTVAAAMSGNLGEMPDSSVKMMAETAGMLREIGIREEVIADTLRGHEVSPNEYKLVEAWKARQMKDPVFVKAYLSGDPEARQKMTLAAIVLSGSIKGAQTSF
jgi:hypothetical protein